jgi:hypothetical protein
VAVRSITPIKGCYQPICPILADEKQTKLTCCPVAAIPSTSWCQPKLGSGSAQREQRGRAHARYCCTYGALRNAHLQQKVHNIVANTVYDMSKDLGVAVVQHEQQAGAVAQVIRTWIIRKLQF